MKRRQGGKSQRKIEEGFLLEFKLQLVPILTNFEIPIRLNQARTIKRGEGFLPPRMSSHLQSVYGITEFDGSDEALVPREFVAVTVNV
jgi:hypothetical protein